MGDVDDCIAGFPDDVRPVLEESRTAVPVAVGEKAVRLLVAQRD